MASILGFSPEELVSLSPEGIMSLVYQEDRVVFLRRMEDRLRGEPAGAAMSFARCEKMAR